MDRNHLDRALKKVLEFSAFFNQYFQHKEPWKGGPGTPGCVYLSANAVRSLAIACHPFMPESAQRIWDQLGLGGGPGDSSWDEISVLGVGAGHKLGGVSPLFARVDAADVKGHKEGLGVRGGPGAGS